MFDEQTQPFGDQQFRKFLEFTIGERYRAFLELNRRAAKGGVVFVGDSITEGFNIHELLRSDKPMYNRGIGGDTTEGVLAKLQGAVLELAPSKVFLLIGTNDLEQGKKPEEIVRNIQEICSRIKAALPDTELYVESVYPVNPHDHANRGPFPAVGSRRNEDIRRINESLKDLSSSGSFTYIELYSKLMDEEMNLHVDYTYDGLHLSIRGYEVVSAELQPYL
jgi:lysophospholipase L1-like esterase